jgi:hypothetical protein
VPACAFAPVFAPRPDPAAPRAPPAPFFAVLPAPLLGALTVPFSVAEAPAPFFAAAGLAVAGLGAVFVAALGATAASARPPAAGACLGALRFGVSSAEFVI